MLRALRLSSAPPRFASLPRWQATAPVALIPNFRLARSFANAANPGTVFSSFAVYQKSAAFTMKCGRARLVLSNSRKSFSVSRKGSLIFEYAPVSDGSGSQGTSRTYKWQTNKNTFVVLAEEAGELLALLEAGTPAQLKFSRDLDGVSSQFTFSLEKGMTASLSLASTNSDAPDKGGRCEFSLSRGEVTNLKLLIQQSIPAMYAWNLTTDPFLDTGDQQGLDKAGPGMFEKS